MPLTMYLEGQERIFYFFLRLHILQIEHVIPEVNGFQSDGCPLFSPFSEKCDQLKNRDS